MVWETLVLFRKDAVMSESLTQTTPVDVGVETDLPEAVRAVLEKSEEPVTLPKLRSSLPGRLKSVSPEALAEVLRRQVAANVFHQYPKYRSQHDRYWDRPMPVHVAQLIRAAVEVEPLALPELRRKLPDYAKNLAEPVVNDELAQGRLHRHPPASKRTGPRFGVGRPEPREYLRHELTQVFHRLEQLGFTQSQLRHSALELLHEEEWSSPPASSAPLEPAAPPAEAPRPYAPPHLPPADLFASPATPASEERSAYQEPRRASPEPVAAERRTDSPDEPA